MRSVKAWLLTVFFSLNVFICVGQVSESTTEEISITFERSEYGLIFTDIVVQDEKVKAMIDFGDPHKLQLSSTVIEKLGLETEPAGYKVADLFGNSWEVDQGIAEYVMIGDHRMQDMKFTSQSGEMETVSEQIETTFNAVVGWGFFKDYFTEIDYANSEFRLTETADASRGELFSIPFSAETGQLIIEGVLNTNPVKFIIDTGSPVSVIDPSVKKFTDSEEITLTLGDQEVKVNVYQQDLSVLSDLDVVGILGGNFLEMWKIVINPADQTLHFKEKSD